MLQEFISGMLTQLYWPGLLEILRKSSEKLFQVFKAIGDGGTSLQVLKENSGELDAVKPWNNIILF